MLCSWMVGVRSPCTVKLQLLTIPLKMKRLLDFFGLMAILVHVTICANASSTHRVLGPDGVITVMSSMNALHTLFCHLPVVLGIVLTQPPE